MPLDLPGNSSLGSREPEGAERWARRKFCPTLCAATLFLNQLLVCNHLEFAGRILKSSSTTTLFSKCLRPVHLQTRRYVGIHKLEDVHFFVERESEVALLYGNFFGSSLTNINFWHKERPVTRDQKSIRSVHSLDATLPLNSSPSYP